MCVYQKLWWGGALAPHCWPAATAFSSCAKELMALLEKLRQCQTQEIKHRNENTKPYIVITSCFILDAPTGKKIHLCNKVVCIVTNFLNIRMFSSLFCSCGECMSQALSMSFHFHFICLKRTVHITQHSKDTQYCIWAGVSSMANFSHCFWFREEDGIY